MLVDKQNELMSNLLFTVHQHGGDDGTWKSSIHWRNHYPLGFDCQVKSFQAAVWQYQLANGSKTQQESQKKKTNKQTNKEQTNPLSGNDKCY